MLYLLCGENVYESWEGLKNLKNDLLKQNSEVEMRTVETEDLESSNIDFSSYSLFSSKKLTIIKRFFDLSKSRREELWGEISLSDQDIILWQDGKVDKRSVEFKFVTKKGIVREFDLLKTSELKKWLAQKLKEFDISIKANDIDTLIFKFKNDQNVLLNEIRKIAYYLEAREMKVADADAMKVVSHTDGSLIWDFLDYFFRKDKVNALKYINNHFEIQGEEFLIIGSIVSQLRTVCLVKEFEGLNYDLLKERIKAHPFVIKKCMEFAKNFSMMRLKLLYQQLANIDLSLKQGKIEPKLVFSLLVASL